jgi:hypothetical protein
MIQRLINRLQGIFNKDPLSVPVITINKSGGASVTISQLVISMVSNSGTVNLPLAGTIQDLSAAINATPGYTASVSTGMGGILSRGLIEGTQSTTAEPTFKVPTSLLWNEMQAASWAADYPTGRVSSAISQLDMSTADGSWLDIWNAKYFATARFNAESDAAYLARTIAVILSPTQNNLALENIVSATHGVIVTITDADTLRGTYSGRVTELPGRFSITYPNGTSDGVKDAIRATIQKYKSAGTDFIYSPTRVAEIPSEAVVASETYYVKRTGKFCDALIDGKIRFGTGWRSGTTGLKFGMNDGMKEQIYIAVKRLDGSIHEKIVSGG